MTKPEPAWRWRRLDERDPGLRLAIRAVGSITNLATLLGLTTQAICQWDAIPIQRVLEIEKITKIDRERLRPDLFRRRKRAV